MTYTRFFAMIATSTIVMFGLMYLNTYLLGHVFWSETRVYMALFMGAAMAVIMLSYMLPMYANGRANIAIFVGAGIVFALSLWLVRSQITVGDTSYMRAMIPHHSIAIMTSSRANISDPRVRELADQIIYAQDKEIAEMRYLISELEMRGDKAEPSSAEQDGTARIVDLQTALATVHMPALDAGFMSQDEINQLFPGGASCTFSFTADSPPVFAAGQANDQSVGLFKISGDLVQLQAQNSGPVRTGGTFAAKGVSIALTAPDDEPLSVEANDAPQEADLFLDLTGGLSAGYQGFYGCKS